MASAHHMEGDMAASSALYAVLYAPGESGQANRPVKYDVRLRRMLCTIFNEIVPGSSYAKPKYRFGDGAAEAAISDGVEAKLIGQGDGRVFLTRDGEAHAKKLWEEMPVHYQDGVNGIRGIYESLTDNEALVFFYGDYPERADEAGERSEFDKNRLDCAVSMAQGDQISVARSAKVAGMRVRHFEDEMVRHGITPYPYDREAFEHDQKNLEMFP